MNIDANTARLKFCSINYFIRFNIYKFYFTFYCQILNFFCLTLMFMDPCIIIYRVNTITLLDLK